MSQSDSSTEARTYSITEVGQISGLAPHTLRWYEELGLIEDVARGPGGRRVYSELHLGWLEFTASVRDTGMSVADMKRYVSLAREGDSTVHARRNMIEQHRADVRKQSADLGATLRYLDWKMDLYDKIEAGETVCASAQLAELGVKLAGAQHSPRPRRRTDAAWFPRRMRHAV